MSETPQTLNWVGSKMADINGYEVDKSGQEFVHRMVYRESIGPIPKGYHVHHIDKDKRNNDPDNLIALTEEFHNIIHEVDRCGFVLKDKRDVQIALTFFLRGRATAIYRPIESNSKRNKRGRKKKAPRIYNEIGLRKRYSR